MTRWVRRSEDTMTTTAVESAAVDADGRGRLAGRPARARMGHARAGKATVGVHVRDGVVTLTGAVENYGQKIAAARAAHRVRGVLDVADELAVRPASGDEIHGLGARPGGPARPRVGCAGRRPADHVHRLERIRHARGRGRHAGAARRRAPRRPQAQGRARRGRHRSGSSPSAQTPRKCASASNRRSSGAREREAERIHVAVEDGVATLTGPGALLAGAGLDRRLGGPRPGVHTVDDHLRVDPWF